MERLKNLYNLSIEHGWEEHDLENARKTSVVYKEFDVGVVILSLFNDTYILTALSEDNKHTLSMWRTIRSILKTHRDKPIITYYTDNVEKLLKASERYDYFLEGGLVIFPTKD